MLKKKATQNTELAFLTIFKKLSSFYLKMVKANNWPLNYIQMFVVVHEFKKSITLVFEQHKYVHLTFELYKYVQFNPSMTS